mmetsp:Transcript_46057/g.106247  ORF Transcript_46057/g.106247 Transcript_46057/m.106247 type:complete len:155 (+) Transcript_46057:304-768(+)
MMLTWLLHMEVYFELLESRAKTVEHPHSNLPAFKSAVGVALQSIFPITNAYWYVRISGWMRVQWGLASDFELAVLETLLYTMYTANGEFVILAAHDQAPSLHDDRRWVGSLGVFVENRATPTYINELIHDAVNLMTQTHTLSTRWTGERGRTCS